MSFDFRKALNTISDVVQNRPIPLREFDQIYMKVGDMVIQAEFIARKFDSKKLVFIGDGDAISLSIAHLKSKGIFEYGPSLILVLDFDERIVNSINRFAQNNDMQSMISAELYNVAYSIPEKYLFAWDAFYTNPPWGASNEGKSVISFMKRGIECIKTDGMGVIVIADDVDQQWTQQVLHEVQSQTLSGGFIISEMVPGLHNYHLDDSPELKSCSLIIRGACVKRDDYRSSDLCKEVRLAPKVGQVE